MKFEYNRKNTEDTKLVYSIIDKINNNQDFFTELTTLYQVPQEYVSYIKEPASLYWQFLSRYAVLSEDFIRENANDIDWGSIAQFQKLSESFIREFKDKLLWWDVVEHIKLSEDFIDEFMYDYDFQYAIFNFKQIDEAFVLKHIDNIDHDLLLSKNQECFDINSFSIETQKKLIDNLIIDLIYKFKETLNEEVISHYVVTEYMREVYLKYAMLS
jgi:hypothetical protein